MRKEKIITYQQAIQQSEGTTRYLLLGNGFSMALFPDIFSYKRLFEEADFKKIPHVKRLFEELKTFDFEIVIRNLLTAPCIVKVYEQVFNDDYSDLISRMESDANLLKEILVQTIAGKHPGKVNDIPEEYYHACKSFLAQFKKVYTLNYDILLYWALLHDDPVNHFDINDGFINPDPIFGCDYRVFDSPHSPTFFFLHGALHIFDAGTDVRKFTWSDTGIPLMEQVRDALDKGLFPLFVAEGTSNEKITKINHSAYLSKALRSFESICDQAKGSLFIFGHSLESNDAHILHKIDEGKIRNIFVSVYQHPKDGYNKEIITRALNLGSRRERNSPTVYLFDAASANVWGDA